MKAERRPSIGLTLIEVMIAVAALAILAALLLPAMIRSHSRCCRINCVNNVKQIGLAFRQWSLDNQDKFPTEVSTDEGGAREWAHQGIAWRVFQVMSNELNTPRVLHCPSDTAGRRVIATTFGSTFMLTTDPQISFTNNSNLSYCVNPDATQIQTNLLLTGDSHFEVGGKELTEGMQQLSNSQKISWSVMRHEGRGNLCFSDGSVRPFTSKELPAVFKATGLVTNRLVLP